MNFNNEKNELLFTKPIIRIQNLIPLINLLHNHSIKNNEDQLFSSSLLIHKYFNKIIDLFFCFFFFIFLCIQQNTHARTHAHTHTQYIIIFQTRRRGLTSFLIEQIEHNAFSPEQVRKRP